MFHLSSLIPHHKMYEAAEARLAFMSTKKPYELVRTGFGDISFESLTFQYGSQLFHVGFADEGGDVCHPKADKDTVIQLAEFTGGHACIMRMDIDKTAQTANILDDGWGLRDALSNELIDPNEVPEKLSEISEFEMYDLASRLVVNELKEKALDAELQFRWNGNPYFTVAVDGVKKVWVDASCDGSITTASDDYTHASKASFECYYAAINFASPPRRGSSNPYSFLMIPEIDEPNHS